MGKLESELISLGFQRNRPTNWTRQHETVQIVRSSERPKLRVMWREYWKDFLAIIFDYSKVDGPICIVPSQALFRLHLLAGSAKSRHMLQISTIGHKYSTLQIAWLNYFLVLKIGGTSLGGEKLKPGRNLTKTMF
jgi:hypothetical protein